MNPTGVGIQCLLCGDCIFSDHVHDFKPCKCGSCFVDGGFDYLHYGAEKLDEVQVIDRTYDKRNKK